MSEQTVLYGCIEGAFGSMQEYHSLHDHNKMIIESLPREDVWPPLTRNMFYVPERYTEPGFSRIQVIHFGASFNNFSQAWGIWLEKFESLLKSLYWYQVHLHLTIEMYGSYNYLWKIHTEDIESFFQRPPFPIERWLFEGGPREFLV